MGKEMAHSGGHKIVDFCTIRPEGDKCPCGNDYKTVVKKAEAGFKYPQLKNMKAGPKTFLMSQEAHHIVCVATVTKFISRNKKIRRIVKQTVYCINEEVNMIALPLFAHTVHWYSTSARGRFSFIGGEVSRIERPPFADLPNHNYDHEKYIEELHEDVIALKGDIQEAGHDYDPSDLAGELEGLSDKFRGLLVTRGKRRGGTHLAWEAAMHGEDPHWYEPFSMASDGDVTEKAFPGRGFDEERARKLEKLKAAILNQR